MLFLEFGMFSALECLCICCAGFGANSRRGGLAAHLQLRPQPAATMIRGMQLIASRAKVSGAQLAPYSWHPTAHPAALPSQAMTFKVPEHRVNVHVAQTVNANIMMHNGAQRLTGWRAKLFHRYLIGIDIGISSVSVSVSHIIGISSVSVSVSHRYLIGVSSVSVSV